MADRAGDLEYSGLSEQMRQEIREPTFVVRAGFGANHPVGGEEGESTLIVIGGPPGSGKTTAARRLSSELGTPLLGSDVVGRIIRSSEILPPEHREDAYRIAYEVVFGLCEHYLGLGLSVILDINMAWEYQWDRLDEIAHGHPNTPVLRFVLRCPKDVCLERIQLRLQTEPTRSGIAFFVDPVRAWVWEFFERLERSDASFVDAQGPEEAVYEEICRQILTPE